MLLLDVHHDRVHTQELEAQQEIALELLGERNERVEELVEDMEEMKRIFHQELDNAMGQLAEATEALAAAQKGEQKGDGRVDV